MPSIRFRTPGRDEADTLTALAQASKRIWGYPQDWMALWTASLTVTEEQMAQWYFELGESDDGVVGFFAVSSNPDFAELEHFWISPTHAGRGIGKLLFERALALCRQRGVARLRVVSDPNAEGFYRRLGGTVVAQVPSVPAPRQLPVLEFEVA